MKPIKIRQYDRSDYLKKLAGLKPCEPLFSYTKNTEILILLALIHFL